MFGQWHSKCCWSLQVKDPLEKNPVFISQEQACLSISVTVIGWEKRMEKVSLSDGFQSVETRVSVS